MGPIRGSRRRRKRRQERRAAVIVAPPWDSPSDWWDGFSKRITGPLLKEGCKFESIFKISRKTFNYICSLVEEDWMAKPSSFTCKNGKSLSINDQVAIALRRLCSGESLLTVGSAFGINHSIVSQVTWRFVEAMEEKGLHHLMWPSSEQVMETIKSKFEKMQGLPNCCGVIDTTHIMMCLSKVDSSNNVWIDHEKNHSMILQVIVDSDMRFRDIVIGWPGSMNEHLVLQNSGFFKQCEEGIRLNGQRMEFSEGSEVKEYIIGDAGFPLLSWLLTPYQKRILSDSEGDFNKRHHETRLVAQRALTKLKDMWRIIQGEMWRPDKHRLPRIILVCCLLHNIIIDQEDEVQYEMPMSHNHDMNYKQQFCNVTDKYGSTVRDNLCQYLTHRTL